MFLQSSSTHAAFHPRLRPSEVKKKKTRRGGRPPGQGCGVRAVAAVFKVRRLDAPDKERRRKEINKAGTLSVTERKPPLQPPEQTQNG